MEENTLKWEILTFLRRINNTREYLLKTCHEHENVYIFKNNFLILIYETNTP